MNRLLMPGLLALMLASALAGAELLVGWAAVDITPDRPVAVAGQLHTRVSKSVHDPLTATVLALETKGAAAEQAIMISCDLVSIVPEIEAALRLRVREQLQDFDGGKLFLNATHTHTAPVLRDGQYEIPPGVMLPSEYRAFLVDRLSAAVAQAWRNRKPGGVSWALGKRWWDTIAAPSTRTAPRGCMEKRTGRTSASWKATRTTASKCCSCGTRGTC